MKTARLVDWVGQAVLGGAGAGLVIGVGLRLAMRLAAIIDPRPVEFTVGGTVFLVLGGMVVGSVLGLVHALLKRPLGRAAGAVLGLASALLVGFALLSDPGGEARVIGEPWVNALTFPGSFLVAGLALPSLSRWAARHMRLAHRVGLGTVAGVLIGGLVGGVVVPAAGLWLGRLRPDDLVGVSLALGVQASLMGGMTGTLLAVVGAWPRINYRLLVVAGGLLAGAGFASIAWAGGPSGPLSMGPDGLVLVVGSLVAAGAVGAVILVGHRLDMVGSRAESRTLG